MPNIKSAVKRDEKSKQLRAKNRADKTALKTVIKKFDAAVEGGRQGSSKGSASQEQCSTQEVRNDRQAQQDELIPCE